MNYSVKLKVNPFRRLFQRRRVQDLEHQMALKIEEDTRPFVPTLTGAFVNATTVNGNKITYNGAQANYLYEGKVMVDALTGKGAFYIPNVGFRFRRGARLMPTDRNLVFTNPKATDHWMEYSEEVNEQKWNEYGEELLANEFGRK